MKRNTFFIAVLFMSLLASCSSDNDDNTTNPGNNNPNTDYFPSENGDYWAYDVSGEFSGRDSLYIANDTVIGGSTYKKFKVKDFAYGFYSGSLANNGVRKSGDRLLVSGSTSIDYIQGLPIELDITDFPIFKESAGDNEQLGLTSGVIEYNYQGIPLKFEYTMKSVFQQSLASYTVPNYGTYQDVKAVKIIVNLKITGMYGSFPFTAMETQDVLVSTQYYAKNIGMVYADTAISYQLADFSVLPVQIPFPTSGSQNVKEFLADYEVSTDLN